MRLEDFDFDLPERLIATRPARPRTAARLLVAQGARIHDATVAEIGRWLRPGDRLVLNDTRVIPARLTGRRLREMAGGTTEARIEATLLAARGEACWQAMIRPLKRLREGDRVTFGAGLEAVCAARQEGFALLRFNLGGEDFAQALARVGAMPLPPYIAARRPADAQDREDYQTVFARRDGSVAAPTAALHFDRPLLDALAAQGVAFSHVTLHVGAGTFLPVKVADVRRHRMHAEWGEVSETAAAEIRATRAGGGRVIAVGTTALRLIETAARGGEIAPWRGETDIFIYPGFRFRITDALMTNFHLPRSTLIMLVAALMGQERIRAIYRHAITNGYRFFSYGDASLLIPD
ncbi:MAG: tRNA preQ1(34) S-adenosylmethionine ribosyltransferase-isomerase QueA [Roseovarius sp.]